MDDTTPTAKRIVHQILMSKSAEERLQMCAELYEEAKEFAAIGMPEGLLSKDKELFIFQRIHGVSPNESVGLDESFD